MHAKCIVYCAHLYVEQCTDSGGECSSYTPCPALMSHVTTRNMFALLILCLTCHMCLMCHANTSHFLSHVLKIEIYNNHVLYIELLSISIFVICVVGYNVKSKLSFP